MFTNAYKNINSSIWMETWSPLCTSVYTSFILCIPALLSNDYIMRVGYTLLTCLSILHHAKYYGEYPGKEWVDDIDTKLVIVLTLYTIVLASTTPFSIYLLLYWVCLLYIYSAHYGFGYTYQEGKCGDLWHSSVHIVAIFGVVCLMIARNDLPPFLQKVAT